MSINEMLEEDKDKRKPSKYFLEKIREQFSNKYSRNTSIDGIVRCLYTFEDITKFYKKLDESQYKNKTITEAFIKCLKNFTGQDMIYYINSIKYFREILCTENSTFNKTKEINPKLVLTFLIRKLHDEMNINISTDNKVNNYYITSGEERAITSKIEMMIIFQNKFYSQLNSYISQKMMGLIKSVYVCNYQQGKNIHFSFGEITDVVSFIDKSGGNYIFYTCETFVGSCGAPIISSNSNKVVGVHQGSFAYKDEDKQTEMGIVIQKAVNDFINSKNLYEI